MDTAIFDELQQHLDENGPTASIDRLCSILRERGDYSNLFYALLLKKRHELGASLVPTGPAQDLPESVHASYEDAIREAARLVGRLYLDLQDIPHAWVYFRMIGEPGPVVEALERYQPAEGEDIQPLVEIAYHHGVNPRKGFDWIVERFGICNAITTASGFDPSLGSDVREYCVKRLVRALHQELCERLKAEIIRKEGSAPANNCLPELMAHRDWLFEDDSYHVDVSHLSAVVQMSIDLPPGEELDLARELCAYGSRLSPRFLYPGEFPFEDQYRDYGVYLAAIAGDDPEVAVEHFRAKLVNDDPDATRAAEVLVKLFLGLNRPGDALAIARRYLACVDDRRLMCPSIVELCQRANDFSALAEVARAQADPVHFLAGLITSRQNSSSGASLAARE
jgi:hypothetical protein